MRKKTILSIVLALLFNLGSLSVVKTLTPPKTNYPIKIQYISINGVKDDNTSSEMIDFAIGKLEPGKTASFEISAIGDFTKISHLRVLFGRNDLPSLINSDEVLIQRIDLSSTAESGIKINFDALIPDNSKGCWVKFWPIFVSKDAKIIGGANTRPWSLCKNFYTPQITTGEATDITHKSAVLNGDMWYAGNIPPDYVWFQIRSDEDGYDLNQMLGFKHFSARDTFSYQLEQDLLPNKLYYFRAIAGNLAGINYAPEKSFKTLPGPLKVNTITATDVSMKEWVSSWEECHATLNGEVVDNGNSDYVDVGFYWYNNNEKPKSIHKTDSKRIFGPFEKGQKIPFSEKFFPLDGSDTFIFIAYAINSVGVETPGEKLYFPPPYQAPELEVKTLSQKDDCQYSQATLYAELENIGLGGPCEIWFDYCDQDLNNREKGIGEWKESPHITVDSPGTYSITITGLPSDRGNIPWYSNLKEIDELIDKGIIPTSAFWVYRAHAKNVFNQEDIDIPDFSKNRDYFFVGYNVFGTRFHPVAPVIRAMKATNVAVTSADLNVAMLWTGFDTKITYWAEYWPKGNIGSKIETMRLSEEIGVKNYNSFYVNPNSGGPNLPSFHIEDLKPFSTYFVKFFATNSSNKIYESNVVEFKTKYGTKDSYTGPIIETISFEEISPGDVICHGKLINPGKSDWIKIRMEFYVITRWSNGNGSQQISGQLSTIDWGIIQNIDDIGYPNFEVMKYGLATNQEFWFRFVAENNAGQIGYGKMIQFTTLPSIGQAVRPKITLKIIRVQPTTLVVDGYIESIGQNVDGKPNNLSVWFWAGHIRGTDIHMCHEIQSQIWTNIDKPTKVSWYLTNLEPGTSYGVQFYAQDKSVFVLGDGRDYTGFITPIIPPETKAIKAEFITNNKALLNADILSIGSPGRCKFWIEWGIAENNEIGKSKFEFKMPFKKQKNDLIVDDTPLKGFSWEANNLKPNTYYVFRVVAEPINKWGSHPEGSQGYYYSNEHVFKTTDTP